MKEAFVRRFSTVEVVYHSIQLVLYLILFVTGGMLLLKRLFEVEKTDLTMLSNVHRLAGLVLVAFITQTIIISVFSKNFRPLWKTVLEVFKWHFSDIVWLVKVIGNTFSTRITLPPAGRFNAGQKLHLLVIVFVLFVFSITGLIIIFVPGSIGVWVVHALCFIPSLLFLALHLFLSLVNPSTRKALEGIITGHVPVDYARTHHPLWQESKEPLLHTNYVSLLAVILTTIILAGIVIGSVWYVGIDRVKIQVCKIAGNYGRELILPGMLVSVHAEEPDAKECTSCHNYINPPPSTKCLKCHKEISNVINKNQGYHGTLQGQCRDCHVEHNGLHADIILLDSKSFNHDNTRYILDGKHRVLECVECHNQPEKKTDRIKSKYIDLKFESCIDCHQNPHPNFKDDGDCLSCHTMDGWLRNQLVFDHNQDSKYKLEGKHIEIACEKCHFTIAGEKVASEVKLTNIGNNCKDCHDDLHKDQFQKGCESCHSEYGWKGPWIVDSHSADSAYPLIGKHINLQCIECHKLPNKNAKLAEAKLAGLFHECSSCHDDIHKNQITHNCAICHNEHGWKGNNLLFVHNQHSSYKLDDLHKHVLCSLCHFPDKNKIIQYKPLPQKCDTCHFDIVDLMNGKSSYGNVEADPHAGRVSCIDCHQTDIARQFPYQYANKCAVCHNPRYYDLYFDWKKSMAQSIKRGLRLMESLSKGNKNYDKVESIRNKIKMVRKISFHNIQLNRKLFEDDSITGLK